MFLYLSKIIPLFFYPIGLSTFLTLLGLFWIWRKRLRWAVSSISLSVFILLFFSAPVVSMWLLDSLEDQYPEIPIEKLPKAQAIVVLGGSIAFPNSHHRDIELTDSSDRILHASRLYKAKKAPLILMSGGNIDFLGPSDLPPESQLMAQLAVEFGVPKEGLLTETTSRNTYENARNSLAVLQPKGIKQILLVTSAFHMPRSVAIFRKIGFTVIPATTDFRSGDGAEDPLLAILPSAQALNDSTLALKEWVGLFAYRLRGWA
ncbi:MAG: YdcF family protein [Anaerolineae bacterium]|nr:YdcF family protein [Gloeobacterales cyanobacterium ES-bin-313]